MPDLLKPRADRLLQSAVREVTGQVQSFEIEHDMPDSMRWQLLRLDEVIVARTILARTILALSRS